MDNTRVSLFFETHCLESADQIDVIVWVTREGLGSNNYNRSQTVEGLNIGVKFGKRPWSLNICVNGWSVEVYPLIIHRVWVTKVFNIRLKGDNGWSWLRGFRRNRVYYRCVWKVNDSGLVRIYQRERIREMVSIMEEFYMFDISVKSFGYCNVRTSSVTH